MPEGHTIHRLARRHLAAFGGHRLEVSSPQGRFAAGAERLHGRVLAATQAHGKHLFLGFAEPEVAGEPLPGPAAVDRWLHVHLGLYGAFTFGNGTPPEPRGAVRVRLVARDAHDAGLPGEAPLPATPATADGDQPRGEPDPDEDTGMVDAAAAPGAAGAWADLRGPTACEVITAAEVAAIRARLGPDPLRRDASPDAARARIVRSRTPLGALLMQQDVVAGVGNVYRAEALFRGRLDPWMPGRDLHPEAWDALWADLRLLLRDGVRRGRIVTTLPSDRARRSGPVRREDAHYVYRRTGLPCRVCGTSVLAEPLATRTLYRCPVCQDRASGRSGGGLSFNEAVQTLRGDRDRR